MAKGKKGAAKASPGQPVQQNQQAKMQAITFTLQAATGGVLSFKVLPNMACTRVRQAYCERYGYPEEWLTFTFNGQPVALDQTILQIGIGEGANILVSIPAEKAKQYHTGYLAQPRPALLILTYMQLESEVRQGILDCPHWSGAGYECQMPPQQELLPDACLGLLYAGCGFMVNEVPADIREALVASERTPADLKQALQLMGAPSRADAGAQGQSSSGSKRGSRGNSSSKRDHVLDVYLDGHADLVSWVCGLEFVGNASRELGLPLAVHLPLPGMAHADSYAAHLESAIPCSVSRKRLGVHLAYLYALPAFWTAPDATFGYHVVPAATYEYGTWRITQPLPDTALAIDVQALQHPSAIAAWRNGSKGAGGSAQATARATARQPMPPAPFQIPGTAARLKQRLQAVLKGRWEELPWLRGGAADLYVIAPDEDSYGRILRQIKDTIAGIHMMLATQMDAELVENPNPPPSSVCNINVFDVQGHVFEVFRWPFCSPLALVSSFDVPSAAAWFDGQEVYLDERCAWCHANHLLLAEPQYDSARYCARLLKHASRLRGYHIVIPGPLGTLDYMTILDAVGYVLGSYTTSKVDNSPHDVRMALVELIQKRLRGISCWVVLHACHMLYGRSDSTNSLLPDFDVITDVMCQDACLRILQPGAESSDHAPATSDYAKAMELVQHWRELDEPFSGFYKPLVVGPHGEALQSWYTSCELGELARSVWLAVNGFLPAPEVPAASIAGDSNSAAAATNSAAAGSDGTGSSGSGSSSRGAPKQGPGSGAATAVPPPARTAQAPPAQQRPPQQQQRMEYVPTNANHEFDAARQHPDGWLWMKQRLMIGKNMGWDSSVQHQYTCSHSECYARKTIIVETATGKLQTRLQGKHNHAKPGPSANSA